MAVSAQFYQTWISSVIEQTACIRTILFQIPPDYPRFHPGHVVQLKVSTFPESQSALSAKSYCICSLHEDNLIEICFDLVNINGVSGALYKSMPGQSIGISAPMGGISLQTDMEKGLIFVGFGSGVGLIRGLMRQFYRNPANWKKIIHFYAINRDETTIPYKEDLKLAMEQYPNLEIYPVMQTNGYDTNDIGDRILTHTLGPNPWLIYLVGPSLPVRDLRRYLLDMDFLPKDIIQVAYD